MTDARTDQSAAPPGEPAPDLTLSALCEALLLVAAAPTPAADLAKATGAPVADVEAALAELGESLRAGGVCACSATASSTR